MTRYTGAIQFSSRTMVRFLTLAIVAATLSVSSQANATPIPVGATAIVDSDGFEATATPSYDTAFAPPGLPVGSVEGQFARLPGDMTTTKWDASIGTTNSTAVVEDTTFLTGAQALQVDRGANDPVGGGRWATPVTGWPSKRHLCIEWDMRVEDSMGPSGTFGPFFGVEAYDDDGVGASNGRLGAMGVDATTGDVLYLEAGTEFLAETGATVNFGEWNHFHLDFDFDLHQYSVILNGTALEMGGVGDLSEGFAAGSGLDQFTDADIATFAAAGDALSQALTGTAYVDNFVVYELDVKIPEPSSCILALLALLALSRARLQRG